MVVGFVFEEQEPGLILPVHGDSHMDGAGVDLLTLVQFIQIAVFAQIFGRQGADVHEVYRLCSAQFFPGLQIVIVGCLQQRICKFHLVNGGEEGGMAAVIGPVGVDHADFRNGGAAAFPAEIGLTEGNIVQVHSQAQLRHQRLQAGPIQIQEAFQGCYLLGNGIIHL